MDQKVGFIGLGRMGQAMVLNVLEKGVDIVGYNRTRETTDAFVASELKTIDAKGTFTPAYSVKELVDNLGVPRIVFLMIKAGKPVDAVIDELLEHGLTSGSIVIDGGNSFYKDSQRRYEMLRKKGITYVDCGTSGGIEGARTGACMMVGGDKQVVTLLSWFFEAAAVEDGWGYMGSSGAGHFVKMVHNGIEYGMMAAIAEGLQGIRKHSEELSIESLDEVLKVYSHGSIIAGSLMNWARDGYADKAYMDEIAGSVPKGETEDEMGELVKLARMPILEASLAMRQDTRTNPSFAGKVTAMMRNQFGGHKVKKKGKI